MSPPSPPAPDASSELRKLPRTDRLLEAADRAGLVLRLGRGAVLEAVRTALETERQAILGGHPCPAPDAVEAAVLGRLEEVARGTLRPVVNATGVVVHTNLGRAPLAAEAIDAMRQAAEGYLTLEYDLESGERGDRYAHAEAALCRLTGAEAALVVNNGAAAVLLALAGLGEARPGEAAAAPAEGRPEVIVSRGQLVEIGGGFRIPDVLLRSGAALVEVGTTNRTYARDFEAAVGPRTRALLSVHRSNFRVSGFVHDVTLEELVALGRARGLWVVDDVGSGTLIETRPFGLGEEPTVQARVRAGADVVTFSGDKLLGGPQAGLLVGRREALARLRRHPLLRALRIDKVTLAGLMATLSLHERGEAETRIPVWRALATEPHLLAARARAWCEALGGGCEVRAGRSAVGGGSLPEVTLPTSLVTLPAGRAEAQLARLRQAQPPVIARIEDDRVVLDPRTVLPGEDEAVLRAVRAALATD
ncbi:MAG: L-seryl-tRNA(Sec) selenium transferase [Anaeromyxobacter sp.]